MSRAFKRNLIVSSTAKTPATETSTSEANEENPSAEEEKVSAQTQHEKMIKETLTTVAIFLKQGQKFMGDRFDVSRGALYDPDDDKELLESFTSPVASREFMHETLVGMFKFCMPFIEQYQDKLSITEASMSLRAL